MENPGGETITLMLATTALVLLLTIFIIFILQLHQNERFALRKNLDEMQSKYERNLLQTQLETQEQTFQHVSRDIHDSISLSLILSKLHLSTLPHSGPVKYQEKIDLAIGLMTDAIHKLRNIAKCLNADLIKRHGLLQALEYELIAIEKTGMFTIHFEVSGSPLTEPRTDLFIFRIIQEALNNILKHSHATSVRLKLEYSGQGLHVGIEDNGTGFAMQEGPSLRASQGLGLVNIRQRTKILNGSCEIISAAGKGTSIHIYVPLPSSTSKPLV